MNIKNIEEKDEKIKFTLEDSNPATANAIRRTTMREIPTMAITEVDFFENTTSMYDEYLAHRLGMVPLESPDTYEVPETEEEKEDPSYSTVISLTAKGPGLITASELKMEDPEVEAVHPETPIVKLDENQELELEARARMGTGREHARHKSGFAKYKTETDKEASEDPETTFEFEIESYRKRKPKELLKKSLDIIINKSDELKEKIGSGDA